MLEKIDKSLHKICSENSGNNKTLNVIIYANNLDMLIDTLSVRYDEICVYDFICAVGLKIKNNDLIQLSQLNTVKYITSVSMVSNSIHIAKEVIHYDKIYNIKESDNKSIAIIDTGIFTHIDFVLGRNRIVKFVDLVNKKTMPYDDNGHGTFVAGLVGANDVIYGGYYDGVDKGANLIIIKALNDMGEGDSLKILEAMQYVLDNKEKLNIGVVCMSFGSVPLGQNDPLVLGSEVLWNNGIVVVAAAGNNGPEIETIKSPGSSSKVITVGAMDDDRNNEFRDMKVADFSSRGPSFNRYKPDIIVSGVDVVSTARFDVDNTFYTTMSGTSVSTPIVAGVALKLLKHKTYSPDQIKKKLLLAATPIIYDRNAEGFGLLDLEKLVL